MKFTKSLPVLLIALTALTAGAASASGKNFNCDNQNSARNGSSHFNHAGFGKHHGRSGDSSMHKLFKQIDTDGDGKISKKEMDNFRSTKINTADLNKDGALSLAEFEPVYHELTRTRMVRTFQSLDTDGDGLISKEEMDARFDMMMKRMEQKEGRKSK